MLNENTVSRRGFLAGAGAAAVAATALSSGVAMADEAAETSAVAQRLIDRGVSGAALPEAAPILPVAEPETWDAEADVVVVGLGAGGLVASIFLAQQGLSVIGIDKDAVVGGASRHAGTFVNAFGGAASQVEAGFPGTTGGDINAAILNVEKSTQFSTNEKLVRTIYELAPEACDYIVDLPDMPFVCIGAGWQGADVAAGVQNNVLGMNGPINALEADAQAAGVDIRLMNQAEAFVTDAEGRVVGVMVDDADGNTCYLKAAKGVVLMAGGFGMNKDLIKAYLPSAVEGAVQGGPMPTHTGEVFRMGLGVGADFSGYDSWSCWEGAIDETTMGGDGHFWHYFWHGERQLFHNPWLLIDKAGNRLPYHAYGSPNIVGFADLVTTAGFMSAVGHKAYNICDADFATNIFEKVTTPEGNLDECRLPITDGSLLIENNGLVSGDWLAEVEQAVERGAVKKADTLEELAEMLGLDPEVLVNAVEHYNEICEAGVDTEMAAPYDPSWLHAVKNPPFYGAIVGGQIGKTLCGLRINNDFQVIDENGKKIAGLYAGYSTAGGFVGECSFGAQTFNGGINSGVGSSFVTGYIAAKKLLENE